MLHRSWLNSSMHVRYSHCFVLCKPLLDFLILLNTCSMVGFFFLTSSKCKRNHKCLFFSFLFFFEWWEWINDACLCIGFIRFVYWFLCAVLRSFFVRCCAHLTSVLISKLNLSKIFISFMFCLFRTRLLVVVLYSVLFGFYSVHFPSCSVVLATGKWTRVKEKTV